MMLSVENRSAPREASPKGLFLSPQIPHGPRCEHTQAFLAKKTKDLIYDTPCCRKILVFRSIMLPPCSELE